MTALDQNTKTICELIDSCRDTQEAFRYAAETVASSALKRLFGLYAQQRSRFAEELGGFAAVDCTAAAQCQASFSIEASHRTDEAGLLSDCLRREESALALYRKALAERTLPTKARFLVSAQLALLERVHNRIESIGDATRPPAPASYRTATL
jgi:uncharacterized protein (TIGR02284 family)